MMNQGELVLGFASPTCVGLAFVEDDPRFQQAYLLLRPTFAREIRQGLSPASTVFPQPEGCVAKDSLVRWNQLVFR